MCPYFYTTLINLLGPAKNVRSHATTVSKYREIGSGFKKGNKFKVETPTTYMISIEFHNSALIQGFASFDVINHQRNHIELYGTKGSMIVPDPNMFGGPVSTSFTEGGEWEKYSTENMQIGKTNIFNQSGRSNETPTNANYRGVGLSEMISCIDNNKEHRCNGNLALHVLDLIESTINSAISANKIELQTICEKPKPFTEKEISQLIK